MPVSRKRRRASAEKALHAALTAQLNAALSEMTATLPVCPIELTVLRVDIDIDPMLLLDINPLGTVIAPTGVVARYVDLHDLPKYARPGQLFQFDLALSSEYPCTIHAELEAAVASLVPHVTVDASIVCEKVTQPLFATVVLAAGGRSVCVTIPVPDNANRESKMIIRSICVAGQPVTQGQSLPAHVAVVTGIIAPQLLEGAAADCTCTPVISSDGTLYVPKFGCPDALVFSADGIPLPTIPVASLGLSQKTQAAALDEATSTLLFADICSGASKLVAVDAVSRAVRWSTAQGEICYGIAVLPAQEIVAAGAFNANKLRVYRLADGALVSSTNVKSPSFIAVDPATATLYVNTVKRVTAFRWNGGAMVSEGVVDAIGDSIRWRPLAVMPPAPSQHNSYLVVGTFKNPTLLVLSLPDCSLVHTHTLERVEVVGLAAEPSGTALAVCDAASKALHVLPWPLPGMPPLQ
jgi:hypothetical protein